MFKGVCKLLANLWRKDNSEVDKLYYLYGIKPIGADRAIEECTVGREF